MTSNYCHCHVLALIPEVPQRYERHCLFKGGSMLRLVPMFNYHTSKMIITNSSGLYNIYNNQYLIWLSKNYVIINKFETTNSRG